MRIAMVSEHASPLAALGGEDAGGQNVHVAALAGALARRGVEVVVHTRRDDPGLPRRVPLAPGVVVDHVDAGPARTLPKDDLLPFMGDFARELEASWREQRPDAVHAHFWMSGLAALDAAAPLGVPVVQTFHALGVVKRRHHGARDTSPPARVDLEREILRRAGRVVATCTDEVFELVRLGADRRRTTVIPCGVDHGLFSPRGASEPRPQGRRRILSLCRLVERKGVDDVVRALPALPDAELVVAGGPDPGRLETDREARRLAAVAREVGVEDRVELRGRVGRRDAPVLLRSADVAVCVPWYEPFGIVPLEAMACGVPVVASRVGGQIDTVVHGETGIHVPPRDPSKLAGALRDLLVDEPLRRSLGEAGARRSRRLYGWDRIAAATLEVYAGLVQAPRRRRARQGAFA